MKKFENEYELVSEAKIQAYVHIGKRSESLEDAINSMPISFWEELMMHEKDRVEYLLKKHFSKEKG